MAGAAHLALQRAQHGVLLGRHQLSHRHHQGRVALLQVASKLPWRVLLLQGGTRVQGQARAR